MSDLFKKYLEGLVENDEDVVQPKVNNQFTSEESVDEEVVDVKEESKEEVKNTNSDIDALIKKMLPQFGKMEEEVLDKHEKGDIDRSDTSTLEDKDNAQPLVSPSRPTSLHKNHAAPYTNSILDTLRKQPTDVKPKQEEGLKGVEYEEYDPSKIRFMKELSRHELLHKDHSSLIIAKKCLREYFLSSVVNLVLAEESSIFYPWGTAYHIYRQRLNEHYGFGDNEPTTYDPVKAKASHKLAAKEGTTYWMEHGEDQKPGSKYDWYTTERLYKSFVKAFEHWVMEKKKGQIKVVAVEQYFTVQLPDGRFTSGRIDEAVLYQGELWGRDYKTTQKPEEWFSRALAPNNQVRTYTYGNAKLAGNSCRGIIIQAMYNAKSTKKEDKGPLVYEKLIEVSPYELKQWEAEQIHWNRILELCREHDIWPQSEVGCQWCPYQIVCIQPTEAAMVHKLETKFKKKLRDPAHVDISVD